jgi:inositol-phosphate phosphatase / L-galactose 1-phosphate phosphatase / histidinol-phosphatase
MDYDLTEFRALACRLADAAGAAIKPYFRAQLDIQQKDDASPVTLADQAAERAIRDILHRERPKDGIWGEEFGQHNITAEWVWVLDPIDGTRAFTCGKPVFATLIGLTYQGRSVLGLIDQPILSERWLGDCQNGARFNGEICKTSDCVEFQKARFATTAPEMFNGEDRARIARLTNAAKIMSWGGDAYNYALLASGHIDLVVEKCLKYHDFAALAPLIEAAGGVITDWSGQALSHKSAGDVIAAATPELQQAALAYLR